MLVVSTLEEQTGDNKEPRKDSFLSTATHTSSSVGLGKVPKPDIAMTYNMFGSIPVTHTSTRFAQMLAST